MLPLCIIYFFAFWCKDPLTFPWLWREVQSKEATHLVRGHAPTMVTMETGTGEGQGGGGQGEGRMEEAAGPWAPCVLLSNPCHITPEQRVIHLGLPQVQRLGLRNYSNNNSSCCCFHGNDTSLSLQSAPQLLRTGLQPDSLTSQGELPSHRPIGVEGGSTLYLFSIISVLHSPRALHPRPDLLPGMAGPLGMFLGWGHLGLCSSYIIASVNTGNVVLFPRHDCTRLLDGTCSFQEKAQIHSQS